jgi:hypothetical protein
MKKVIYTAIFACIALSSVEVNAQTSKGDIWLGGASNLGLTITPDFGLNASVTGDYFLKDRLSLGAAVDLGIGSATTIGLSPRVQYFITESIYANLNANVLSIAGGETSAGLNGLNAGVGYWYSMSDNVVFSPMLHLGDLTGDLGISAMVSFQVKL